jgi:hypothetical protein
MPDGGLSVTKLPVGDCEWCDTDPLSHLPLKQGQIQASLAEVVPD